MRPPTLLEIGIIFQVFMLIAVLPFGNPTASGLCAAAVIWNIVVWWLTGDAKS